MDGDLEKCQGRGSRIPKEYFAGDRKGNCSKEGRMSLSWDPRERVEAGDMTND